jgi:dihydroorotase
VRLLGTTNATKKELPMLTRREFLQAAAAAGALTVSRPPDLAAAKYDLLVKGGRVIDPGYGIDRVMDVAITGGRIADLQAEIPASEAAEVINAQGKLVTPGLVDIHSHVAEAGMPPSHCLSTGVTAQIDAGSRGADNVGEIVEVAKAAPNRVRILLNLARRGLGGGVGELLDFKNADVAAARRAIETYGDVIIGVKGRLSRTVVGDHDLDAIRRAREIVEPLNRLLMFHVGQTASPMSAIVDLLRPGDIVTHMYSPPPNAILDENGRVFPEVREARRRGILFDIGNGRNGHITWEVAERAIDQDFLPDTISSDLTAPGITFRVFDFPTVLSKFLLLGVPLDRVIACGTVNAARAIPAFQNLGTLRVGAPADVAIFELQQGNFEFVDNADAKRTGHQKLVTDAVIASGKRVR